MDENHAPLEECKLASLAAENLNFPSKLNFEIEYAGALYQADSKSYEMMLGALAVDLPDGFYWLDKNNNRVLMTKAVLQELASSVQKERFRLFNEHQNRKEKMRNATDVSQLFG